MKITLNTILLFVIMTIPIHACNGKNLEKQSVILNNNTKKVPVVFSHGFGGSGIGKLVYVKGYEHLVSYLMDSSHLNTKKSTQEQHYLFDRALHWITAFNYDDIFIDLGIYGSIPNPGLTHLGQINDIHKLHTHLQKIQTGCIGFGVSRGAATWLTTLGTQKILENPKAVILESPFATTREVNLYNLIHDYVKYGKKIFDTLDADNMTKTVFSGIFQKHKLDGIQPIKAVKKINKNIPILLIHSQEDTIIPIDASRKLYVALREAGHNQVYLLELDHGKHAGLLWGKQGKLYRNVVHTFYKELGLPHEPEYTVDITMKQYQPSIDSVKKRLHQNTSCNQIPQHSGQQPTKETSHTTTFNVWI